MYNTLCGLLFFEELSMNTFGFFFVIAIIGGYVHARLQMRNVHRNPHLGTPVSDNMVSFLLNNK